MLGAVKPASIKGTAVFDPRTAATLLVDHRRRPEWRRRGARSLVLRRTPRRGGRLDRSFTLIDDPTDPRHFAASPFDGEGLACRRNVLIERRSTAAVRLRHRLGSTRRYRVDGQRGARRRRRARPRRVVARCSWCRATLDQDEIFRRVGDGVFVESLTGVHSGVNPISGDFSVGVTGLMIRDGALAEPIREVTVASTLQRMLLDVLTWATTSSGCPGGAAGQTLAIDGIAVSGS